MPIQMRSDYGVEPQRKGMFVSKARKLAQPYASDPFAQATLAEAEYDADNDAEAEAAADRALATDPNYIHALIYKGRAKMQRARANPATVDWNDVRGWFAKANRLDTENAAPLMLYYQSFVAAGDRPTETATKGLLYAMILAPQDQRLRWIAVRQLLLDHKLVEAKRALAPIAYDPHMGTTRDTADLVLAAIESGDSTKGVAMIDSLSREWKRY